MKKKVQKKRIKEKRTGTNGHRDKGHTDPQVLNIWEKQKNQGE